MSNDYPNITYQNRDKIINAVEINGILFKGEDFSETHEKNHREPFEKYKEIKNNQSILACTVGDFSLVILTQTDNNNADELYIEQTDNDAYGCSTYAFIVSGYLINNINLKYIRVDNEVKNILDCETTKER